MLYEISHVLEALFFESTDLLKVLIYGKLGASVETKIYAM